MKAKRYKLSKAIVTITELEMTERPLSRPPAPEWAKPAIFQAPDIPLSFYRHLYHEIGREYHWAIRANYSDARLSDEIHREDVEIYVLYLFGAPAGFYEILRRDENTHYLIYFGITKMWQGKGIGAFLLGHAIDTMWSKNPQKLRLGTCTLDHPKALTFYQKMGFEPAAQWKGERDVFYDIPLPSNL